MPFMCECRGPCRRAIDITPDVYRELRMIGTVVTPECAQREDRFVLHEHNPDVVVVLSISARHKYNRLTTVRQVRYIPADG